MKNRFYQIIFFISVITLFVTSCNKKRDTLFELLPSSETGVTFSNFIQESDSFNILTYEYIYNGGGVATADFNNDGLQDLFFSGNAVPNRLYINQGNLTFKDISDAANVNVKGRWNSGVAVVDINNDGLMDIYVCATTKPNPEDRRNMLFVNQGLNEAKEPTFKEMAADYKIDFNGHSVMAAFFDYDRDNDLDLFVLVNVKINNQPTSYREKIVDGSSENNDKLYRNNGNGTFTDVTLEAGILEEGFGLGLAINDFNKDGWPDIYVSNDYLSNDILYLNNQDGKFINRTKQFISHQSQFSMGNDAADINNDGLPDLITLDMLPEINERKKTTISNKSYTNYINNEKFSYDYQYVRNMLQLNNGVSEGTKFSEIGQLSGVYQTEWSWSPLFADFDNDGFKDLVITNGFPKDITDKDFANYRAELINIAPPGYLVDSIPVVKIPNFGFKNNGDHTFTDVSKVWGLDIPSFSNGAAFADLDNDGDLDYVVNNINSEAFIYKNTLYNDAEAKSDAPNYLRVKLLGLLGNPSASGSSITIFYDSKKMQYDYSCIYRGYLSSVENTLHFGLGNVSQVDSLLVSWPDGKSQIVKDIPINKTLSVEYQPRIAAVASDEQRQPTFLKSTSASGINFKHNQTDVIDFNIQRTLPHKYSQYGPAMAVADINGDLLDDLFIGSTSGNQGTFYIQKADGKFELVRKNLFIEQEKIGEDASALFFDADNDGDQDLYVVSGGFEWPKDDVHYQDRLYKNDGHGVFTNDYAALPKITASGSCVRAADFDADGDLDLFVGGRVVPAQYPMAAQSYLLQNNNGQFVDVTNRYLPLLTSLGMVTDAVWSDFDNDGKVDLVVSGELMPVTFIKNKVTSFEAIASGIEGHKGWWNSIVPSDFDRDGDIDYIVGNLGENNPYHASEKQPLKVIAKDFDKNGSIDAITSCYSKMQDGSMQLCPVHFWDELNAQSPRFRRQFSKYKQFSKATTEKLFTPKDLEGALILEGNDPHSSYIENLGTGKFRIKSLPTEVQFAPVFGGIVYDVDKDGNDDVLLVGNDFSAEVFSGRYDAFTGIILRGNGKGDFSPMARKQSGFYVPGDAKSLVRIKSKNHSVIVASQNKDSLRVAETAIDMSSQPITLNSNDAFGIVSLPNKKTYKIEFYYGQGFYSQSTRKFDFPTGATEIVIYDFNGKSRRVR